MIVSGNELVVTVQKACIGAGVSRGVAEEIGRACLELARMGMDGLSSVISALDAFQADGPGAVDWRKAEGGWTVHRAEGLCSAPSFCDFALTLDKGGVVKAEEVDFPMLFVGCALVRSRENGVDFGLKLNGVTNIEQDGGWLAIGHLSSATDSLKTNSGLALMNAGKARFDDVSQRAGDLTVEDRQWKRLGAYAKRILVPASKTNRADAGAGLNDND